MRKLILSFAILTALAISVISCKSKCPNECCNKGDSTIVAQPAVDSTTTVDTATFIKK